VQYEIRLPLGGGCLVEVGVAREARRRVASGLKRLEAARPPKRRLPK
jgi:hypothetical protein